MLIIIPLHVHSKDVHRQILTSIVPFTQAVLLGWDLCFLISIIFFLRGSTVRPCEHVLHFNTNKREKVVCVCVCVRLEEEEWERKRERRGKTQGETGNMKLLHTEASEEIPVERREKREENSYLLHPESCTEPGIQIWAGICELAE